MNKYLYKNKKVWFIFILLSFATYYCVTQIYNLYAKITEVTEQMDRSGAYAVLFYSISIFLILLVLLLFTSYLERLAITNITVTLRKDIFDKIYTKSITSFERENTAYYTSMLVNDVTILEEDYFRKKFDVITDIIQLVIMLVSIGVIGIQYVVIVCLFSVVTAIQPFLFKKKLAKSGENISKKLQDYTNTVNEHMQFFETIKNFGKKSLFKHIFIKNVDDLENANAKLWLTKMFNSLFILLGVYGLKVGSQLFFTYNASMGFIAVSTVSLLFGLANNVGNPIASILSNIEPINSTKNIRLKIQDFLNTPTDSESTGQCQVIKPIQKIQFKDVNFSYDGVNPVLKKLNVIFESGKKYALVGASGCGKSTILKMIMGYYDKYQGEILIDDNDLSFIIKDCLREQIAYINQKAFVENDTIFKNITLNEANYSEEQVEEVMKIAKIYDLYKDVEESTEDCIEKISGGEKQRISIARALLRERGIILMDEATSGLDNVIATSIEESILENEKWMIISILHRFNKTIKLYDCIFFVHEGEIIEAGSYDELISMNGKFCEMMKGEEEELFA